MMEIRLEDEVESVFNKRKKPKILFGYNTPDIIE